MGVVITLEGRGATVQQAMNDLARQMTGLLVVQQDPGPTEVTLAPAAPAAVMPEAEPKKRGRPRKVKAEEPAVAPAPSVDAVREAAQAYGTEFGGTALVEKIRQAGTPSGKLAEMKPEQYAGFLASLTPIPAEADDEPDDLGIEMESAEAAEEVEL